MHVKAAGGIEVAGTIQKAYVEAEGDIIVRQGIIGRDEAQVESTAGSVYGKFLQNGVCMAEQDVVMGENIMHSRVYAGGNVVCNGKRAQLVGGEIICGGVVRVKSLGAMAATPTHVMAGVNPRAMQHVDFKVSVSGACRVGPCDRLRPMLCSSARGAGVA